MKNKTKHFISVILFCTALFLFLFNLYQGNSILDEKRIETSLNISDKQGIDLNGTTLTFGNLIPGTTTVRKVKLKNNYEFPITILINVEGRIKKYLEFERRVEIEKDETKEISFVAKIPDEEKKGDYDGRVLVTIKK
jgi:hypothetical protein